MKTCGNCALFSNEESGGDGWCEFHQEPRRCENVCETWLPGREEENKKSPA